MFRSEYVGASVFVIVYIRNLIFRHVR